MIFLIQRMLSKNLIVAYINMQEIFQVFIQSAGTTWKSALKLKELAEKGKSHMADAREIKLLNA